jgi:rsbT antagonist protein RsbS
MGDATSSADLGMSVVRGCLLVPIQGELHDDTILGIQAGILRTLEATAVRAAIIDLSAVRVLDTFAFEVLAATARMASLLGATTLLAGIQPGAASALVDLGVPLDGIRTALTLEDAFEQLRASTAPPAEPEVESPIAAEASAEESARNEEEREG